MNKNNLSLLGITIPVIQAPMAGVSTPGLAAAVSNAGGLGSLGLGSSNVEAAHKVIVQTKKLTNAPFNANFFCHDEPKSDSVRETAWLNYLEPFFNEFNAKPPAQIRNPYTSFKNDPNMLEMLLTERPAVVSFHFGLPPQKTIEQLKQAGIILMATATNISEANAIQGAGLDFIIAQGWEAGGHRGVFYPNKPDGQLSTHTLLSILRENCTLPLIAAGGIMNGTSIKAALKMGASAVQMGTAFVLCPESAAGQGYRESLSGSNAFYTDFTAAMSGRLARGLTCRVHTEIDKPGRPDLPDYPICYAATKALQLAAKQHNNIDFDSYWAGQGAPLARAMPAGALVKLLDQELNITP